MNSFNVTPVAYARTDFKEKFGIPRQSGRSPSSVGEIVFLPEFSSPDAFRELEGFSHVWLLFDFSACRDKGWSTLVRPPRLGGNKKVGVFASRSPFRPNGIGLSSVKLEKINYTDKGVSLTVSGIDLLDGTPIIDVKPYIPSSDCHLDAVGGYADQVKNYKLQVVFDEQLLSVIPQEKRRALLECLADDPRPSYQDDGREYGMTFAGYNVKFTVNGDTLTVTTLSTIE